jgi:hypothetical protein
MPMAPSKMLSLTYKNPMGALQLMESLSPPLPLHTIKSLPKALHSESQSLPKSLLMRQLTRSSIYMPLLSKQALTCAVAFSVALILATWLPVRLFRMVPLAIQ